MVQISDRTWAAWDAVCEEFPDEPSILLRFVPVGDAGVAERAVLQSVREVQDARGSQASEVHDDPPFAGEWDVVRDGDVVLVKVVECDILAAMLPAIGELLERRGIDGVVDVADRPPVSEPPRIAHLLECRLRIRGHRHSEADNHRWVANPDARAAVLEGAERWCRRDGERAAEALAVAVAPLVAIAPGEDVLQRLRDPADGGATMALSAVASDGFRILTVDAHSHPVVLVAGGPRVEGARWRTALAELIDVLRVHADVLAYAFVKRGSTVTSARAVASLRYDWPPRMYDNGRRAHDLHAAPFEDTHAPDAFGVQLLGPGYAGRVPRTASWRAQPVGTASTLLEHVDLAAWFDAPFVPYGNAERLAMQTEPPPLLVQARKELAPILYTPEVRDNATSGSR